MVQKDVINFLKKLNLFDKNIELDLPEGAPPYNKDKEEPIITKSKLSINY